MAFLRQAAPEFTETAGRPVSSQDGPDGRIITHSGRVGRRIRGIHVASHAAFAAVAVNQSSCVTLAKP